MTTGPAAPGPPGRAPTPRLKAPPTSSTTSESVTAFNARPPPPAPAHAPAPAPPAQGPRRAGRAATSAALSDKATTFLIRRVLCPQEPSDKDRASPAPIEELLPPLTSRNDVDLQLYAIMAIVIRESVQNWYGRLTPDEDFVAEIVQIVAHCTRALEQRLRKVDLESLLFDELPELLDRHVHAYRTARNPPASPPVEVDHRAAYHSLCPLPCLSPVPRPEEPESVVTQAENEAAYRQLLVQGVLAMLLPTEDLGNDCLNALVGQIFSELAIGGAVARKAPEPWLIWEGLIILSRLIRQKMGHDAGSTLSMGYARRPCSLQGLFWSVVSFAFAAFALLKLAVAALSTCRSLPSRRARPDDDMTRHKAAVEARYEPAKVPVVAFGIWQAASSLIELDARMPWLCGTLEMMQWLAMTGPGQVAAPDGVLDRLLSHYLHQHLLDPSLLPPLLRNLRGALFPNNTLGKPTLVAPTSDAELAALRRRCANALWALVPRGVGRRYFGATRSRVGGATSTVTAPSNRPPPRSGPANGASNSSDDSSSSSSESSPSGGGVSLGRLPPTGLGRSSGTSQGRQGPADHPARVSTQSPAAAVVAAASDSDTVSAEPGHRDQGQRHEHPGHGREGEGYGEDWDDRILAEIEAGVLDVFADAYCNKHLMYSALELVLVRLMPELADKGIAELLDERLS